MTSVIVTVFQQVRTLTVLLECLEDQVCPYPWEVIVTDDGSESNVAEVVHQAAARKRLEIKYAWQPDRGFRAGAARNSGIKIAKGEILVFLDGDMLVPSDFIAQHTALHDGRHILICGTRQTSIISDDCDLKSTYKSRQLRPLGDWEINRQRTWARSETPWMTLLSSNFSVPRGSEVVFDENFQGWGYEDRELAYRLMTTCDYEILLSEKICAFHVCSSAGTDYWNPLHNKFCGQEAYVNLIRNALYFVDLYPGADLTPTLDLLRRYHIDPLTDDWYFDEQNLEPSIERLIAAARKWMLRHGISVLRPRPRAFMNRSIG